jgi:predicted GNAT superfamily acetyltransferase
VAGSQAGGQAGGLTGDQAGIAVRPLTMLSEFSEALKLQKCIWGFTDNELMPLRFFVVASKIGGQVLGAFDGEQMVGFGLSVPGIKLDGHTFLHSHMLGVLPAYRNSGVGRRIKLAQRSDALARGIDLIEWTFDPLEVKNAYFNIERLGVIVRRYVENQYGSSSSPLHAGLPTDRCVAEWWIALPRAKGIPIEERISVPAAIGRMRHEDPERAREIQRANAARFQACFEKGLAVIGFERSETEGVYLLGALPPPGERDGVRERIRQIEAKALRNLYRGGPEPA